MGMKKAAKIILPVIVLTCMGVGGIVRGDDDMEAMAASGTSTVKVCLPPSWSLKLPTSQRFETVLESEAVLDWETGLVWGNYAGYYNNWLDGVATVHGWECGYGTRSGWRVPTIEELASLVDPSVSGSPKLPSGHPFINVELDFYWSSTTRASGSETAYYVDFTDGSVGYKNKDKTGGFLAVRTGNGYVDE